MALGNPTEYIDSKGEKHIIQEYGRHEVIGHTGGSSPSFVPEGVYIDGQRWAEFDNIGIGNPIKQAQEWIEEQIKHRTTPRS